MKNTIFEKRGNIAVITLNSPQTLNSLSSSMMSDINECLDLIDEDREIFAAILTGTGRSFCAGADIKEMLPLNTVDMLRWSSLGSDLNSRIEKNRVPFIAAVNGYALGGGCELSMACDIRLASSKAKFGLPETSLGVICGAGGTQRLPRIVGEGRAKELLYTAKPITAEEAYRIGLVNHVYQPEILMDKALEMASDILKNAQIAVQQAKRSVTNGINYDLQKALEYEHQIFCVCCATEDKEIGMEAFVNKSSEKSFKYR